MSVYKFTRKHGVTEVDSEIGQKIRLFRKAKGMPQAKLAEELDISTQQVQKYESGMNRVSASRLFALSAILQIEIIEFFPSSQDHLEKILELDKETERLLHYWSKIKDPKTKKAILEFIKNMSNFS